MSAPITSFHDAMRQQADAMLAQARRLDERGYAVIVHRLNQDGSNNAFLDHYLAGGFEKALETWANRMKRPALVIHVYPAAEGQVAAQKGQSPLVGDFGFLVRLPTRVRFRPILTAVEIMGKRKRRIYKTETWRDSSGKEHTRRRFDRFEERGSGLFESTDHSDYQEVRGNGRAALEALLRILEMPQHMSILTHA